jgi:hypothetical protein
MTPKESSFPFTHEEFLELMVYDQDTGILSWRNRKDTRVRNTAPKSYIKFKIKNVHHGAHRLIWFYHYGRWPESDVIDHIDRNKHNNRIENLREATFALNAQNRTDVECYEKIDKGIFRRKDKFVVKVRKTFASLEEAKDWQDQVTKIV